MTTQTLNKNNYCYILTNIFVIIFIEDTDSNVNDLQNFVNIALATAAGGEGDYNTDKLINLRIVGSGFGQLIYKLPQNAGYETLQRLCTSLWTTLEETGDLPDKMV